MKGLTLGQTDTVGWTDGKKRLVGEKKRKRSLIEITRIYKKKPAVNKCSALHHLQNRCQSCRYWYYLSALEKLIEKQMRLSWC